MTEGEHRRKVTLALDHEDLTRTIGTMFQTSGRAKFMDWPSAVYSMHQYDRVAVDGETVGVSTWISYSANEGEMLTLAVLDADYAEPGTEVTFVWGEEDGGTAKPTVESHEQTEIRAVVGPVPYVEAVRTSYAPGSCAPRTRIQGDRRGRAREMAGATRVVCKQQVFGAPKGGFWTLPGGCCIHAPMVSRRVGEPQRVSTVRATTGAFRRQRYRSHSERRAGPRWRV